ncbi:MAG TPA: glycosyltransferase family 4 protein [Pyrinomonadaceae bacterium]|jgi:glycosyltransferase involved in cell wall biosynthesis|nr:glycosyltransferase family 4 protein [Pyrinomonadaceae bacterium]
MKILYLTTGAANMYCGSCLRDNALATELIAQGHDVMLLPVYTPTLTDEPNVSRSDKVLFGGISVYLQQHASIFRKTPWLLDKLWDSTAALKLAARRNIPVNPKLLGELTVSMLRGEDGRQRKEFDKMAHWLREQETPDVVTLPNSLLLGFARPVKQTLQRPVVCTLQGEDLFLDGLEESYRRQSLELIRASVEHVDAFVAVSEFYAGFMSEHLHIPASKMRVVPLGINLEDYGELDAATTPPQRTGEDIFTVGYFARVAPEKGLHLLCEAYRRMRERDGASKARLEVAGYLAPEHEPYLRGIERQMREWGLGAEFNYRGAPGRAEKIAFLRKLHVFSMPATYDEPKGISLLEAMACGVPVVQPRRGACTEIIEHTGGGLLVAPDDAESLAHGLYELWKNPARAAALGREGARGVRRHYSVARMAERALEVYELVNRKS